MLSHGGGHVIQITTSLVDHAGSDVPSVLASLTKSGLRPATKSPAIEYFGCGIHSTAVVLGIVKTPARPEASRPTTAAMHPLGRMGEPEGRPGRDLPQGAFFATSEILAVDGGQSADH
ncbi:hypothetical protein ACFWD7_47600 [Streptomyces mirabilis]|uniref:hypothetical protein n=1 Tax=Streptomyces mirabilis TaxID=68239 RepID=UPI0036AF5404